MRIAATRRCPPSSSQPASAAAHLCKVRPLLRVLLPARSRQRHVLARGRLGEHRPQVLLHHLTIASTAARNYISVPAPPPHPCHKQRIKPTWPQHLTNTTAARVCVADISSCTFSHAHLTIKDFLLMQSYVRYIIITIYYHHINNYDISK